VRLSVNAIEHPIGDRIAAVLILAFCGAECGGAAEKFKKLSGPQIRAGFTGMEMTDSVHFADMFAAAAPSKYFRWEEGGRDVARGARRLWMWARTSSSVAGNWERPWRGPCSARFLGIEGGAALKARLRIELAAKHMMVAGALMTAAAAPAAETFKKLSGPQIRSRLAGMDLTDEVHWREAYMRDGSFMSRSMGRTRTGSWRIEDGELCVKLTEEAESGCYEVWVAGAKFELRPIGPSIRAEGVLQKPAARK
jgi:hypothetical protein